MQNDSNVFEGASVFINEVGLTTTETLCGTFPDKINSTEIWLRLKCQNGGLPGNNIKIQLQGRGELTICGMRVYGSNDAPKETFPGVGIALDVSSTGDPYIVSTRGLIYRGDAGQYENYLLGISSKVDWTEVHPDSNTKSISIGPND